MALSAKQNLKEPVALVAKDLGPKQTLAPFAASLKVIEPDFAKTKWDEFFSQNKPQLLICGTSDSLEARREEGAARAAAKTHGLPIVSVEDFPGNYSDFAGSESDFLIVESEAAANAARMRLGGRCPTLFVVSPARYDALRRDCPARREATFSRWENGRRSVIWFGQPETEDGVATLNALIPHYLKHNIKLLFRAHPRDSGYFDGSYEEVKVALGHLFEDVSTLTAEESLSLAPWFAVTQFSSMTVEAGFWGIPSVCVLFPFAGGHSLQLKKGYSLPPACEAGAVACCSAIEEIETIFDYLLNDRVFRDRLLDRFDDYYSASQPTLEASIAFLESVVAGVKNPNH